MPAVDIAAYARAKAVRRASAALPPEPAPPPAPDAPIGAFAQAALELHAAGLFVIPVDDKEPLVSGRTKMRARPSVDTIARWCERWPDANIGIVCGELSGVVVVDIDDSSDPAILLQVNRRCGDTPLKTRTPSSGWHRFHRWSGEGCANLRSEGLPVDIKGRGGFVVAPPSVRRLGAHAGRPYTVARGSWDDLSCLPTLKPGALKPRPTTTPLDDEPAILSNLVRHGRRANTLLRDMLREVPRGLTEEEAFEVARALVADHYEVVPEHPFTDEEIRKAVRSALRMEAAGENWVGHEARVITPNSEHRLLRENPEAYVLYQELKFQHFGLRADFVAMPEAMAMARIIPR
jgi:hypothetical protein